MNTEKNNNPAVASEDNTAVTTTSTENKGAKKPAKTTPHVPNVKVAKDQKVKTAKPAAKKPAKKAAKPAKPAVKKATPSKKPAKPVKVAKVKTAKPAAKKPSKKTAERTANNFDRNFGRIKVNGESLSKGRAVHAVILSFVEKKKPTAAQLQAAFPAELLKNYGIVQEASKARKYSVNGKTRFFVSNEDLIKTKDGKSFAVCNQFSTENVKPFIKHAKTLGFIMTPTK